MILLNHWIIQKQCYFVVLFLFITVFCRVQAFECIEEKILALLPVDSKIAEIPKAQYIEKNTSGGVQGNCREFRKGIIYADLTGEGREEVVIAYYTPPHEYIVDQETQEGFFSRARVAIFEVTEDGFTKSWESQGWGHVFGSYIEKSEAGKTEYPWYLFGAKDINDDGILELVFSRSGYGAMGAEVEIWAWNNNKYVNRLKTAGDLHFSTTENGKLITAVSYHAGERSAANYLYNRDSDSYELISSRVSKDGG